MKMNKQNSVFAGLLLSGSLAFSACSSDDASTTGGAGEAGAGGETSGAAGQAAAGESSAGEGGESGSVGLPPAPLNPQGVIVTAAEPATFSHLLVAGTDFLSSTEIASVTLATGTVDGTATYADGDAVSVSSAGLGFALERGNGKVHLLDGGTSKTTFDLKEPATLDRVALGNKAYVPLLSESTIAVLDLAAGTIAKRIDLSQYNAASDSDGSADIDGAVYDPTKKIAYFLLGRIDFASFDASFHLPCSSTKALVVGIDATTDAVVDLNGDAAGKAAELSLVNPGSVSLAADGSLVVLANGCYEGATLKQQGIEIVDATGTSQVVFAPTNDDYLGKLILVGGSNALLGTSDATTFKSHWYKLDLAAGQLGAELMGVPDAVSFDGKDLLGVGPGGAVIRYDVTSGTATTVSAKSWAGDYISAAATALVK